MSELHSYIDWDFPIFQSLKHFGVDLLHLLFGGTSASLRQLSTRAVFTHYVKENHRNAGFSEPQDTHIANRLVQRHNLPQSSCLHFEIELLRLALFRKFAQFHRMKYETDGFDDSDDSNSGENDSDLEYW